jgi:ribosome-associated protein
MRITPTLSVDEALISESFGRASGPGGPNVNKVSNAVELRFNCAAWPDLPQGARLRLQRIAGRRMTDAGLIVIDAQRLRSLEQNRADAIARLVAMIQAALIEPKPRRATRPTRASKLRRLEGKARDARTKQMRSRVRNDD